MSWVGRALAVTLLLGCDGVSQSNADGAAGSGGPAGMNCEPTGAGGSWGMGGMGGMGGAAGTRSGPEANLPGTYDLAVLAGAVRHEGSLDGVGGDVQFRDVRELLHENGAVYFVDKGDTIRKVELATGVVSTLAGSPERQCLVDGAGASARFFKVFNLASDRQGSLYALDSEGQWVNGAFQLSGKIRRISIETGAVTTVAVDRPLPDAAGIAVDGLGHAYVNAGMVSIVELDLASGTSRVVTGDSLGGIVDLATAGDGTLFVCGDGGIRAVDVRTGAVKTHVDSMRLPGDTAGCRNLAMDGPGTLWVADESRVARVDVASGGVEGFGIQGASAFAPDGAGGFYFPDRATSTLRHFDSATQKVTIVAGDPLRTADGVGADARFLVTPVSMAVDAEGNLYVAESGMRRIAAQDRSVTSIPVPFGNVAVFLAQSPSGIIAAVPQRYAETFYPGFVARLEGGEFRTLASLGAFFPKGLVADGDTGAFVSYRVGSTVVGRVGRVDFASRQVTDFTTVFGSEVSGFTGDGAGALFLADATDCVIRARSSAGDIVTVAGQEGACAYVDGSGADARLGEPRALSFDGADGLYVLDGPTLRKVTLSTGGVVTLLGRSSSTGAEVGRPGGLFKPLSLATLEGGAIAIADSHAVLVATPPP